MIRKIVIVTALVLTCAVYGQESGTSSPYSFYGIGLQQFRGTVENKAMGGLSLYSDSLHLNIVNPAQLGKLRFVNFAVGGNHNNTSFEETGNSSRGTTTALDYLALGFPISKKGAVSFGLMPWTSSGFDIDASVGDVGNRFTGIGSINRAFLSTGFEVIKGLYVGATGAYHFGNIQNEALRTQDQVEFGTLEANRTDFSGFALELGAQYETKISKQLELRASVQYNLSSETSAENFREISSVAFNDITQVTNLATVEAEISDSDFSLPSSFIIGLGIGKANKWFVGGEVETSEASSSFNNSFRIGDALFTDSNSFRGGGFYIPKYNSVTSYFERVNYRAGFRYEELGLRIANQDINEFGISFGVGLPLKKNISNLNVVLEYGQRGTTDANLVQENFFNVGLSLSLNDIWFLKRKFN